MVRNPLHTPVTATKSRTSVIRPGAPNRALIKSTGNPVVQVTIGRTTKAIPFIHRVDQLSLNLRTIVVNTQHGTTINGVSIHVTACCQVKIQSWSPGPSGELYQDDTAIRLAAQHFLSKTDAEIDESIRKTVAGYQRAIISTLTVEELYRDRESFSKRVVEVCDDDMRNMGLTIVSYTVAEITDDHGYIEALGVTQTELVKREATEGKAVHESGARSRKAREDTAAHLEVNKQLERKIDSDKICALKKAEAQQEIDIKVAIQEKAHDIAYAEQDLILSVERKKAKAAEAEAELQVMKRVVEKERLVKQQQVHVEADAMLYKATVDADSVRKAAKAEAQKTRVVGQAKADAEAALIKKRGLAMAEADALYLRQKGEAEAEVIKAKGMADAAVMLAEAKVIEAQGTAEIEVLQERLNMWNECGNQGFIMEQIIQELPNIADAVAAPLAKTEKLVFVGYDDSDGDATQLLGAKNVNDGHGAGLGDERPEDKQTNGFHGLDVRG